MVRFPRGRLRGSVEVPGDKSISHRALIVQAFARDAFSIEHLNPGRDVRATDEALRRLRTAWNAQQAGEFAEIDCMNSGSTARMILGVCAGSNVRARFDGDASLRRRPMEPVAAQLRAFGARIATTDGHLPLDVFGCERVETRHFILLSPSAQVKSALLFAGLFAGVPVDVSGDASSRDHTERLLRFLGADIEWDGTHVALNAPPARYETVVVAGDFSAAAFFITGAVIAPGSEIVVRDVAVNPTRTGLLDALRAMGAQVELRNERERCGEPIADVHARHSLLHAIDVDAQLALRAIDEIPLLAVAAAFADGVTTIRGIGDLRTKESDRIAAVAELLSAVGVETHATHDGLRITGGTPTATGALVRTHDDHRIAMAAATLALGAGSLEIDEASSIDVSFPEFAATLERTRES